jgi:hypothetical protein
MSIDKTIRRFRRILRMTSEIVGKEVITREKGYLYCVTAEGNVDRIPAKSNKTGTRKKVSTQTVTKEKGYLYYVGKDGRVARSPMRNAKE